MQPIIHSSALTECLADECADLVNTGVTVDLNTRQVAGIMTVSVALFTIAQVTDFVFRHESLQDMADSQHIYMLISAILCVLFYLGFTAYLFFNSSLQHRHLREARRRRRVDGVRLDSHRCWSARVEHSLMASLSLCLTIE